ncbi:jerky protein homolog-like [Galendromus occidentalis]|uniref:Jerky protein homolog-like n=1 Tax=Galendromus occidentalis TaxID=34638 RepID=A0AAJ6W092_9ACAR|nr:jerky protein homolog-like [Galendromus occidentalis]
MIGRKTRTVLTLEQKEEILQSLEGGETQASLAERYGVDRSTISNIKKNASKIKEFRQSVTEQGASTSVKSHHSSSQTVASHKVMKTAKDEMLEAALYKWFVQKRTLGFPFSGFIICQKALELNQKLGGDPEFKASQGWLGKFKNRHGIRELEVQGERMSSDVEAAERFVSEFNGLLHDGAFDLDFIYNADETGLFYKALPSRSLAARNERTAPGHKSSKERVTAMVCANATGRHKISMLIIGKSRNPRCFKNIRIPVEYRAQKRAWMDREIFLDWYQNVFIREVEENQRILGKEGKVLLLLDNAPSHPPIDMLPTQNGKFVVIFLPPNVTALLQPMDQGAIECLKRMYRKQIMIRLFALDDGNNALMRDFNKIINLKDCCYMLAEVDCAPDAIEDFVEPVILGEQLRKVPGFMDCDPENILEWLACDSTDTGHHYLTDDEIVEEVRAVYADDGESGADTQEDSQEEEEDDSPPPDVPTAAQAADALQTALQWLESQQNCDLSDLIRLARLRAAAFAMGTN